MIIDRSRGADDDDNVDDNDDDDGDDNDDDNDDDDDVVARRFAFSADRLRILRKWYWAAGRRWDWTSSIFNHRQLSAVPISSVILTFISIPQMI